MNPEVLPSPTTEVPRPVQGMAWWLVLGMGLVVVLALFSSSREKPPVLFAIGFGLVSGLGLRLLASSFDAMNDRRVPWLAGLLVAGGFLLSFVASYQRMAREWNRAAAERPENPIAAALLEKAAQDEGVPVRPSYSIPQYLQRRLPTWPSPWPTVLFCAEWILCGLLGGGVVAWKRPRQSAQVPAESEKPL